MSGSGGAEPEATTAETTDEAITVSVVPGDDVETHRALEEIASRAFPTPQHHFVTFTEHTLAARVGDRVVGGMVFKLVGEPSPVAAAAWALVDPDAQAGGVGTKLLEESMAYLRARNCRGVAASVRWSNTPSSKLIARSEFTRISSGALLRRVGPVRGLGVLTRLFHPMNLSCDLWYRSLETDESTSTEPAVRAGSSDRSATAGRSSRRSAGRFAVMLASHALLVAVIVGGLDVSTWGRTTLVLGGFGAGLLALRWLPVAVMTRLDSRQWGFWSWGNVYPLAGVVAALGGFLPVPGHVARQRSDWSYWKELDVLGPAAAVSATLLVATLAGGILTRDLLGPTYWPSLRILLTVFLVVDLLVVVWPFEGYNGRVIYDWNRRVWAVLAVLAGLVIAAAYLV